MVNEFSISLIKTPSEGRTINIDSCISGISEFFFLETVVRDGEVVDDCD